jgi:hypothetical protein
MDLDGFAQKNKKKGLPMTNNNNNNNNIDIAVHRCRFIHYLSPAINSISFSEPQNLLAVGRANGNIELYSDRQGSTWYFLQVTLTITLTHTLKDSLWLGFKRSSVSLLAGKTLVFGWT